MSSVNGATNVLDIGNIQPKTWVQLVACNQTRSKQKHDLSDLFLLIKKVDETSEHAIWLFAQALTQNFTFVRQTSEKKCFTPGNGRLQEVEVRSVSQKVVDEQRLKDRTEDVFTSVNKQLVILESANGEDTLYIRKGVNRVTQKKILVAQQKHFKMLTGLIKDPPINSPSEYGGPDLSTVVEEPIVERSLAVQEGLSDED